MHLSVLAEHMGARRIPLRGVESQRTFEILFCCWNASFAEARHASKPMSDHPSRIIAGALGEVQEHLREGRRLRGSPSAVRERELTEDKGKHKRRRRAFPAELKASFAARSQL